MGSLLPLSQEIRAAVVNGRIGAGLDHQRAKSQALTIAVIDGMAQAELVGLVAKQVATQGPIEAELAANELETYRRGRRIIADDFLTRLASI